jgi:zinc protease
MHQDKKPSKYVILGILMVLVMLGILAFFALRAQASKPFLPISQIKTPAGFDVWLVEDKTLPIIAMQFWFDDSGSAHDNKDKQGLARLLSNTLDEGAGEMNAQDFQKALDDNSITLVFDASRDGFGGRLKTLTRTQDKAFDMLSKAISSPRFEQEAIGRMRDANIARIKDSMSDPEWIAARILNDKMFEGHPYAQNSGGTMTSLPAITADDLKKFQSSALTQDRLKIVITGNITKDAAMKAVDQIFSTLPKTSILPPIPAIELQNTAKTFLFEKDIPQSVVQIALPAFGRDDPDYYALQVLNYIFGGAGFGSRLMEEVREKRGLTYGIYSSIDTYNHIDILSISTSTKNESVGEMMAVIKDVMKNLRENPVSEQELNDAKLFLTGSMPLMLSSTDSIASTVLSLRIEDLPIDYLDGYAQKIKAVSVDDLQRVAKRILNPSAMVTVLVGKPQNVENTTPVSTIPNV